MSIETVRDDLSIGQNNRLIEIINNTGKFTTDKRGYASLSKLPKRYPTGPGQTGPLALGLIDENRAQLLNVGEQFPEDYHSQLRDIYRSV